jgi:hypothetical protein
MNTYITQKVHPMPSSKLPLARSSLAIGLLCLSLHAAAFESKISGFGTLAAGRTSGSCNNEVAMSSEYARACTRFVVDWGHAGIYTDTWSASEESRIGVQWTGTFSPDLSATVQAVARGTPYQKAELEWAYLTYKINPSFTLQVGRKRIPLYYYSDFQDIGYAYLTARPNPELYGWEMVNYNGANLDYNGEFGDWIARVSVFAGSDYSERNRYQSTLYDDPTNIRWKNMKGLSVELNKDWFSMRFNYADAIYSEDDYLTGENRPLYYNGDQLEAKKSFYGAAFIADYEDLVIRAEAGRAKLMNANGYDTEMYSLNVGHRFGAVTPYVTSAVYHERTIFSPEDYVVAGWRSAGIGMRYEVTKSSALKLQVEQIKDTSPEGAFQGNSTLFSVNYDFVF